MRKGIAVAVAAALFGPATADAAVYRGETDQDRPVKLRANERGVKRVVMRWRAGCDRGYYYRARTRFGPPFDRRTARRLVDTGSYTAPEPNGVRSKVTTHLTARRTSARRWTGTFRATVVVRRRGEFLTRCRTQGIRFTAVRA